MCYYCRTISQTILFWLPAQQALQSDGRPTSNLRGQQGVIETWVSHVHILLQTWCLFFLISPLDHRERGTLLFPTNLSFFCLHLQHMAPNSVTQCLGVVVTCEMNVGANLFYKPGGMTTWSIPWTATFPGTVYKSGSTTLAAEFTPMKMPWDE